jgi:hypothetical protein
MFVFQPGFSHISKDVLYDFNNLVLNSLYQIPNTSSEGCQWVVDCGQYCIVGGNLSDNFQDTILMSRIVCFVVKIMKNKHEAFDILLKSSDAAAFSVFIELFDSSSCDNLTPGGF